MTVLHQYLANGIGIPVDERYAGDRFQDRGAHWIWTLLNRESR
jgi:hypothetical protein